MALAGRGPRWYKDPEGTTGTKGATAVRSIGGAGLRLGLLLALAVGVAAAEKATVTVLAIQATDTEGPIDPKLKDIAEKLKGVVAFKSLKLLSRQSRGGPYGEKQVFGLPEKMELVVTPLEERDGSIRLSILLLRLLQEDGRTVKKPISPPMTVTVPREQGFPIVGPSLKEGRLVLVVSAE